MTTTPSLLKLFHNFLQSRAANRIERQRVIIYLLHVTLIVATVAMQFLGMGASQNILPLTVSGVHLTVCLVAFSLYLARRLTVPQAMSIVAIVSQVCMKWAVRFGELPTMCAICGKTLSVKVVWASSTSSTKATPSHNMPDAVIGMTLTCLSSVLMARADRRVTWAARAVLLTNTAPR